MGEVNIMFCVSIKADHNLLGSFGVLWKRRQIDSGLMLSGTVKAD